MLRTPTAKLAAAVVECFPFATVVIDRQQIIHLANTLATRILAAADGFLVRGERLCLCCPASEARLGEILSRHSEAGFETPSSFVHRTKTGKVWLVKATPLASREESDLSLLSWMNPSDRVPFDGRLIASLYGLSPAETRLVGALSNGRDLASAAEQLGIQLGTARCHLKSTFRKMSVGRQQDLIRTATIVSYFADVPN